MPDTSAAAKNVAGAATAAVAANKTPQELAAMYGQSYALLSSDPALKRWFDSFAARYVASNGQISEDTFILELEAQPWWQQHSATWIADRQQELDNPTDYQQSIAASVAALREVADQMGIEQSVDLTELAKSAKRLNWNPAQQRAALAGLLTASSADYAGQAGVAQDDLQSWAKANGISLSQGMIDGYVHGITQGKTTVDEVKSDLRRTYVAGSFPAWADRISAGQDIADIAAPYKQRMADLLEMDPNAIDFNDPLMQRGLQGIGADGKPAVMPLYEFQNLVRKDSRWQTTDNAYATYANVAQNVLRTFGFGG